MKKECACCHQEKDLGEFYTDRSRRDGATSWCKQCTHERDLTRDKETGRARALNYYHNHRDEQRAKRNTDEKRAWCRAYYDKNKEKILNQRRERGAYRSGYATKRRSVDVTYRIHTIVGNAIRYILNGKRKSSSWTKLLGYDAVALKIHIEKQFIGDMSWGNYGTLWHIDHIIPVSAFNITSEGDLDLKRCWALSNLRPLYAIENLKKGDSLSAP